MHYGAFGNHCIAMISDTLKYLKVCAFLLLLMEAAKLATAPTHAALIDPFPPYALRLTPQDLDLLKAAVGTALESNDADARVAWVSPASEHAGEARVLRRFQIRGMPCAEIEHVFTTGGGRRYVLPFCRYSDGNWRLTFN